MHSKLSILIGAAVVGGLCSPLVAETRHNQNGVDRGAPQIWSGVTDGIWSDNFDSYATGTLLDNVGGWYGWDNNPAGAGTVSSAFSRSGPNSILIEGGGDAVHPFSGLTSGQYVLTAYQYIPMQLTSDTFFIVNNEYNHGGPYTWAVQMQFDQTTGNVLDDFRPENPVAIQFDRWVEIRIDIDLDADTQSTFYDGNLLSTGTWTTAPGDALEIANIDLFTLGTTAYYDDFTLTPAPGVLALFGLAGLVGIRRRRMG